jgi:rhodanese-related sulfurtransferase
MSGACEAMMSGNSGDYAGDVPARAAWEDLAGSAEATLVDVRTRAEWTYVGVPVLNAIGKAPLLVEWDDFPSGELVPDFVGRLEAELARRGIGRDAPLYFICRSGNRSRQAAILATEAGHSRAYNVEFGFEGRLSPDRHRATPGSWKAEGLPWGQS